MSHKRHVLCIALLGNGTTNPLLPVTSSLCWCAADALYLFKDANVCFRLFALASSRATSAWSAFSGVRKSDFLHGSLDTVGSKQCRRCDIIFLLVGENSQRNKDGSIGMAVYTCFHFVESFCFQLGITFWSLSRLKLHSKSA